MKKSFLTLILSLLMLLVTAINGFSAAQGVNTRKKTIKIGWFGPLSGIFQKIGEGMIDGMKAKIDQMNARNIFGGYKIKFVYYDNNMNPVQTKGIVKKLVKQDRIFALVGALGSVGINAVITDLKEYGVPVVYLGGGETHWAVPPKRNIFPVQPDYITEGRLLVKFAVHNLKGRRIAFIYSNDSIGRTALKGAKIGMNRYGRRLGARFVLLNHRSSLNVLKAKMKKASPDVTVVFSFFSGCSGLVSGAKRAGINSKWVTSYVNSDDTLYKMTGKRWLGVYIAAWAKPSGQKINNFIRYFKTTKYYHKAVRLGWGAPSGYHAAGWIAMEIFYGGLKLFYKKHRNMRKLTWDTYIRALERMRKFNDTIAKDITYYPMHMAKRGTRYYYTARSGQQTLYFTKASLSKKGQFYLKRVTNWLR